MWSALDWRARQKGISESKPLEYNGEREKSEPSIDESASATGRAVAKVQKRKKAIASMATRLRLKKAAMLKSCRVNLCSNAT